MKKSFMKWIINVLIPFRYNRIGIKNTTLLIFLVVFILINSTLFLYHHKDAITHVQNDVDERLEKILNESQTSQISVYGNLKTFKFFSVLIGLNQNLINKILFSSTINIHNKSSVAKNDSISENNESQGNLRVIISKESIIKSFKMVLSTIIFLNIFVSINLFYLFLFIWDFLMLVMMKIFYDNIKKTKDKSKDEFLLSFSPAFKSFLLSSYWIALYLIFIEYNILISVIFICAHVSYFAFGYFKIVTKFLDKI